MYGYDDRYIAIDAADSTKTGWKKTVMVVVTPKGGAPIEAGTLAINVTETWPKIALKAGDINLAFPDKAASLMAASPAGNCAIVSAH
jgi:hypothetical protein